MEATRVRLSPNPRQQANFLSVLTFWWTVDMFRKGYNQTFDISDLYTPLEEDRADRLGNRLERQWHRQLERQRHTPSHSPSLVRAIFRTLWKEWVTLSVLAFFAEVVLRLLQPIFLGRMLLYFREGSNVTREDALYYACCMVAVRAIIVLCDNQYGIISVLTGVKAKIAVCSVVYRKSLRLARNALGDTSPGKMVNLMSNDVNRFDIASYLVCFMWTSPLVMLLASVLLWYEIGWSGVAGLAAIVIITPIQSYTGTLTSRYRLRTALKTDERIRLMDEIIAGIAVIKLYAWERPFAKLISQARRNEMREVLKSGYLRALYMSFQLFTTRAAILGVMLAFIALDEDITAAKVFVAASYLSNVSYTMAGLFGRGIAELGEGLVATRRLQRFLEYDEVQAPAKPNQASGKEKENGTVSEARRLLNEPTDGPLPDGVAIQLRALTARWTVPGEVDSERVKVVPPATLSELSVQFRRGSLIGIVGPVGSGKSSVLQVLLRELPVESGRLQLARGCSIAYASQEPWLFTGSLRQNVLFGEQLDQYRYRQVLKVCALQPDLAHLPAGDMTVIGERGVSLSGGQKARICLARAVYRQADVYLLDDPLSAVDAHVAKHLFELCIGNGGFLKRRNPNATRILVTHQVHFLKQADWVVVMKEGRVEAQGTPQELQQRGIELEHLEPSSECTDGDASTHPASSRTISHTSTASTVTVDSVTLEEFNAGDGDEQEAAKNKFEASSQGTVPGSVFLQYASSAGSWLIFVGLVLLFAITQLIVSVADWWLSYWTGLEETAGSGRPIAPDRNQTEQQQTGDPTSHYLSRETCFLVHATLVGTIFFVAILRAFGFYKACARASQSIHDAVFSGFIGARMRFFETNASGRILNRFSKDMGAMDDMLPKSILDATQTLLMFAGAMLVVVFVQPFFMVPIMLLFVVLLFARRVYLRTSQNTRRLEGITRSPIFTHIAATLTGLPTIRAYGVQELLIREFDTHQNVNTGAYFMFHSGRIAFGLFLDSIFFLFLAIVTFSYLMLDEDAVGARVGLAITQIGSIGSQLQFGIRQSAEMFNHLIAVERLLEYRELPAERSQTVAPLPVVPVPADWPQHGRIEFRNVCFRYAEHDVAVLHRLSFAVAAQEKVGIVGRTGAGKSSLIAALFRMALVEGDILIDGTDTAHVPLEQLRSHISIIPQDPVLFSGTLRRNLDPFESYPDEALWRALELVELRELASESSAGLGLQAYVAAGGQNFSVGQRQLLCLARAILRGNRILVLDEATANVDPDTDRLIQRTIREQFAQCTVLTIAHRLNTIMDYDRVLVMSDGTAVEFGRPAELLAREDGAFRSIVLATGRDEADSLMKMVHNLEQGAAGGKEQ
ncbi:AGAP001777-PA [Anopheles gambiae str. PEST]|uniref:AGAP001777-PA n=1 Tax=Anopheles gambiae TaxID=7165 RepID=Q7PUQ0_ANOGA|nr:AGAP001777-PA [Anopheles gambiae str. PEST]